MKIGIEAQCLLKTIGGIGMYTLTLLEALKEQKSDIFCYQNPFRPRIPFANSIFNLLHSPHFEKMDLLHFPEPKILYGKRPKIPIVLTIHDMMPLLFPDFFPKKSYLMMKFFLPRYLREADAIICPSEQTKKDLHAFFPYVSDKIRVIPLALPMRKREIQEKKEPLILYIGSFEPRKNVHGILHAFAKIKQRGFPHRLLLIGKEEGKNRIPKDLILKLGLQNDVDLLGYLSEEKKRSYLRKADLFLWPSFYEGFGLPLLEAMSAGIPIVTSKGSAIEEVVADAAICVDPHDSEAIANASIHILSDQTMSHHLIQKGRQRAEEFSLERFGENHLQLYSTIVKCS